MISTIITGCRTGIGLEFVKQLAKVDNTLVIATYRDLSKAHELKELSQQSQNIKLLQLDVTAFDSFNSFADEVKCLVGDVGLSSIIHNAGILTVSKKIRIEEVQAKDMIDMFTTNTVAPVMLTKALLPLLKENASAKCSLPISFERGSVFFISSDLGSHELNKIGSYWGYRESKTAVNMAMRTLNVELAKFNIGTMSLHPGWVKTKMGGEKAPITPCQSVAGMLKLITGFSSETNGTFYKYDGSQVPW